MAEQYTPNLEMIKDAWRMVRVAEGQRFELADEEFYRWLWEYTASIRGQQATEDADLADGKINGGSIN